MSDAMQWLHDEKAPESHRLTRLSDVLRYFCRIF